MDRPEPRREHIHEENFLSFFSAELYYNKEIVLARVDFVIAQKHFVRFDGPRTPWYVCIAALMLRLLLLYSCHRTNVFFCLPHMWAHIWK